MNSCDEIRELLSLAAAEALDAETQNRVARHTTECAICAAELERWRGLVGGLRRMPTPQPAAGVVEGAQARAEIALAEQAERRRNRNVLIPMIALAWTTILASWPVARLLTGKFQSWFGTGAPETWHVLAGFVVAGWFAGCAAAAVLAWHQSRERRLA